MITALAINGIADINLDSIKRVAIDGESIELLPSLVRQMDEQRSRFVNFVEENHDKHMYGITTAHHIGAKKLLSRERVKNSQGGCLLHHLHSVKHYLKGLSGQLLLPD
jgi:histidine ammonia-lyase